MPLFIGAVSIKGTPLAITATNKPARPTEQQARKDSQEIKKQLRSMGLPYTQTLIIETE